MKKEIILIILILIGTLFFGCTNTPENDSNISTNPILDIQTNTNEDGVTTTTTTTPIFQTITSNDENMSITITKNLLTNKATVEVIFKYSLTEFEEDPEISFNPKSFLAGPFGKMFCGMVVNMVFDPEGLKERLEATGMTETTVYDDNSTNKTSLLSPEELAGVSIEKTTVKLIEKETNNPIYDCVATGTKEENITFTYYGEYKSLNEEFGEDSIWEE